MGDYGALTRLLNSYSNVQVDLYRTNNFDQQLFCQGLAENNGLQKLRLDFQNGIVTDEVISNIILSLTNHLNLEHWIFTQVINLEICRHKP